MRLEDLDPRVKLLMLLCLLGAAMFMSHPRPLVWLLVLAIVILIGGGIPPRRMWRQSRVALGLILALFAIQCLLVREGEPLLSAGDAVIVTGGGFHIAAAIALRLLIVLSSALIVLTGRPRDYLLAMTQSHVPYELAFTVVAGIRFIPLLREELTDVLRAVQMRGMKYKNAGLIQKLRVYAAVTVPVVTGAVSRGEEAAVAMEARAFRALPERSSMRRLEFKRRDAACLIVFLFVYIAALILGNVLVIG